MMGERGDDGWGMKDKGFYIRGEAKMDKLDQVEFQSDDRARK